MVWGARASLAIVVVVVVAIQCRCAAVPLLHATLFTTPLWCVADSDEDDEYDEDEVSDDEEEAPFGVPLGQANGVAKANGGKAAAVVGARQHLLDEEVSEDEEDEEGEWS